LMPLLGWSVSIALGAWFEAWDHWIAFVLLGALGVKMIVEGVKRDLDAQAPRPLGPRALFVASLATSIDAAAAGITVPTLGLPITLSCFVIGIVTFALCLIGVLAGGRIGAAVGKRAELVGGVVLIGIGASILGQHIGWL
ncbi:MAG: manganese efflux pump, partial [Sphingomonadaceae bacterium]|nr:manganese efflux pump [Sphingomonadaceae bacterium]